MYKPYQNLPRTGHTEGAPTPREESDTQFFRRTPFMPHHANLRLDSFRLPGQPIDSLSPLFDDVARHFSVVQYPIPIRTCRTQGPHGPCVVTFFSNGTYIIHPTVFHRVH